MPLLPLFKAMIPGHVQQGLVRRHFSREFWPAWAVFVATLLVTGFAADQVRQSIERTESTHFAFDCDQVTFRIKERLGAYALVLRGSAALFATTKNVERNNWHNYVKNLRDEGNVPGVQGIGFAEVIPAHQMSAHLARIRGDGFPDYVVYPPGERALTTSIIYLEPFQERNLRAFGYDMFTEPVRRAAMEQARDSGEAALSGKVKLLQENGKDIQAGTLMYVPVYRNKAVMATLEQRRAALIGWAYSPYRMNDLIGGILGKGLSHEWKIDALAIYAGREASPGHLLFSSQTVVLNNAHSLLYQLRTMDFNGSQWLLIFDGSLAAQKISYAPAWTVLLGGLVLGILLCALLIWRQKDRTQSICLKSLVQVQGQTEDQLRTQSQRLLLASHSAQLGIWDWHIMKDELVWDAKMFALYAVREEHFPGTTSAWLNAVHPEDRGHCEMAILRAAQDKQAYTNEFRICWPDGSEHWISSAAEVFLNEDGSAQRVAGVDTDITQRKINEHRLRKLALAVEQSSESVVITDLAGRIEYVNEFYIQTTGYRREELIGQNSRMLQSGKTPPESYVALWAALNKEQSWRGEFHNRKKDGSDYVESAVITPLRRPDGKVTHYVGVKADITEKQRLDEELEKYRQHLEHMVSVRTAALVAANHLLTTTDQRLSAMLVINQKAHQLGEKEIIDLAIEEAVRLTHSQIGYIHFVNPGEETLRLGTWSQDTLAHCTATHDMHYAVSAAGVWADAVRLHRPVVHNDYQALPERKDYPAGHAHLIRHLGVPVIEDKEVRLLIGVGNKATDYDSANIQQLQMIGADIWGIIMRHRAEVGLAAAHAHARLIFDSSADGILQIDEEGLIAQINPAACQMLGYAADELLGREAHAAIHCPRDATAARMQASCSLAVAMRAGLALREDNETFWRADGSPLPVTVATHPMLKGDAVIGAVMSFSDNTYRQAVGEEREYARTAAERLAQSKSEFLANMSHEIRTPLNGVIGMAQIGYRDSDGRGKSRQTFARILDSSKLLLAIINDILDFSKIDAGKLSIESVALDPGACADAAVASLAERAAQKGLVLVADKAPDLPAAVLGDPTRIAQVLLNLLSNAIKFTAQGEVRLSVLRVGEQLVYRVRDSGIGMTPEQMELLFTSFHQADSSTTRKYGGTGLGLTISRQLARLMGGEIEVTSQAGSGSSFELRLPCSETTPAVSAPTASAAPAGSATLRLNGLRILAAEDDEVNQAVLADVLLHEGATVELVGNGRLAVDSVARNPAAFDLVLMDVQMPEMDGHEATRQIGSIAPALPVIGQTAHALDIEHTKCRAAGMLDTLTKPLDHDTLVGMILRYARRTEVPAATAPASTAPAQSSGSLAQSNTALDWAQLERRYAKHPGFLTKLLGIALNSQSDGPARLRAAAAAGDMTQLALLAHTLKGTGGNLYAHALQSQAQATETAARNADPDAFAQAEQLAATLDVVLDEIRARLA
ncbi:MAG: PAS domain S-box protein [Rhodocyclaceae bacterium]|nr:MAG: PAS domain S-box protein [Rhodocyclaceae bacterium]